MYLFFLAITNRYSIIKAIVTDHEVLILSKNFNCNMFINIFAIIIPIYIKRYNSLFFLQL